MDEEVVRARWEREQALLGSLRKRRMRGSPSAAWPRSPCSRPCESVVLPGAPYAVANHLQNPTTVIPQLITVPCGWHVLPAPRDGARDLQRNVAVSYSSEDGLWRSFTAVHWHGGVDFFLGDQGG